MSKLNLHTFHIPVMGLAYTIDTPIKVAHLGISSVVSIVDDELTERMRAFYSKQFLLPYKEISKKCVDYRANRIKEYLNLMQQIVSDKLQQFKEELLANKTSLENYISLLPDTSELKSNLQKFVNNGLLLKDELKKLLSNHLIAGDIDVNIMTKVDNDNYNGNTQLPVIYNDAHASLRGFAESNLKGSVVLSAGMNPRLYSYFEQFPVFYPNEDGQLSKKIILKVSDFRSAMIQGNFLAKKGLWVSEYRIESGLNCGGHAFATEGLLLGPILEEFKEKKADLIKSTHELMIKALATKNLPIPQQPLPLKITAQGGVGTSEEHAFLLNQYNLDSVGWGSPFLLVPEATSVDSKTRDLLAKATEKDFYLSNISPLGVPFNTIKGMSNEFWKNKRINDGKAGSSCPKKYLALSKEYDVKGMCTASKKYQDIKLAELDAVKDTLTPQKVELNKAAIYEKACLCVGLVNAFYLENELEIKGQQQGVVICPGPNLAYFDKVYSLNNMVKHIYGKLNILTTINRPNMFIKELQMYIDHLQKGVSESVDDMTSLQQKKWIAFKNNLQLGIDYYQNLLLNTTFFQSEKALIKQQLSTYSLHLNSIHI
ncbi:hypothetical protein P3875_03665 [Myroides sp. JBRI-B21084]|uniref:hypothetical protein n=1 Tax=Myroides sp. JBRI-B21084 TaxID=3119977 RepID=UPI0026E3493E|nr:hypothetical protein [Paenimyroides cloacae]WKW47168.1 hypothetical protein P3875_03665 [Paenimyroides cloacae]